ncbi:MIF4G-domain-containing protein [Aulographum hederae CBS 113979]|uniref:Pre-mRNA-splicing factor CWC22 n=1 Tax=Aulographum hederae CBS 113979 TaxID=1176131 RepID=A0A6G1GTV2_9PEZI|nr:MIF4G-domain-containing protein [Aulographum hederae CBS 113979]
MELQSGVRLPTPEPGAASHLTNGKRKRSPSASPPPLQHRSPSPRRSRTRSPQPDLPPARPIEIRPRERPALGTGTEGIYIPPGRLKALQAQLKDTSSPEFQRMKWESLKKAINGMINKINTGNIKSLVPELFRENLIRGRGLFCRSIMKAQAASLPFTPIYAAMVAVVNTKLPQVGELVVKRLITQFKKGFKRNDKAVCLSSTMFLAHLCNQQVVHEALAAQILLLLLHKPTDDSVEIAVGLTREVGLHMEEMNTQIANAVFDQFRSILHEADIDKRVQYMIEVLFQVRRDRYKDNPVVPPELDLVEEEDQITHSTLLDVDHNVETGLNIFKMDPEWQEHEDAYKKLKEEILGEEDGSGEEDEYETDESDQEAEEERKEEALEIQDQTNTDLTNLRRTIYLTIKSSGGFEESVHKLMRVNIPDGQEKELPSMIIECASQERTYDKFYGNMAERFCKLNRLWTNLFEELFQHYYETIHRLENNRGRIVAQLFGHLLATGAIGWHVLIHVKMNSEDSSAVGRVFVRILFEELAQSLGMKTFANRLRDPAVLPSLDNVFPKDDDKKTMFAVNFFTAIGMGNLTEDMRTHLAAVRARPPPAIKAVESDLSESDSDSADSYSTSSSRSRSRSITPPRRGRNGDRRIERRRSYSSESGSSGSRSHSRPRRRRGRSDSDSLSTRSRSRGRSYSDTPPRRRGRGRSSSSEADSRSRSRSRTPARRRGRGRRSPSSEESSRSRSRTRTPPLRRRSRYTSETPSRGGSRDRSETPPRRSRKELSETPPRRGKRESSEAPPRRGKRERSESETPPRRGKRERSSTPPRRMRRASSSPPPRKKRHTSSNESVGGVKVNGSK